MFPKIHIFRALATTALTIAILLGGPSGSLAQTGTADAPPSRPQIAQDAPGADHAKPSEDAAKKPVSRPESAAGAEQPQTTSRPASRPAPDAEVTRNVQLPYAKGAPIRYKWIVKGAEAGDTTIHWKVLAVDGEAHLRFVTRSRYDALSRRIFYVATTNVRATDLIPVDYDRTTNIFTGGVKGGAKVNATFKDDVATVHQGQLAPGKQPRSTQLALTPPYYIYGDHGFEHWVMIAMRLHEDGPGKRTFFRPHLNQLLTLDFQRVDPKDEKLPHPRGWTRWTAKGPGLSATLWMSDDGILRRYIQGEVDIVYQESGSAKK